MSLGEFIPTSNTKLLLHLNGNSTDSSGNGINGTNTNVSFGLNYGKFGQGALLSRASNGRILIGTNSILQPTIGLTFSMWINIRNKPLAYCSIGGNTLSGNQRGYVFDMDTSNIYFNVGNGTWATISTTATINTNTWYNLIGIWNTQNAYFYFNGSLVNSASKTSIVYTSCGMSLGNYNNNFISANMFDGYIDEVIFENRAWTAQEVKKYYTNSLGRYATI